MYTLETMPNKQFGIKFNLFEKKLILATIILLIFNIFDVVLTLWGMRLHLIEEGNPLMEFFIKQNLVYLVTLKILLPITLGIACWLTRDTSRKLIIYGMGFTLLVYLWIMMQHAYWIYEGIIIS